jgi:hypothetical protein
VKGETMNITYLLGHLEEARQDLLNVSYTASRYQNAALEVQVQAILNDIYDLSERIQRGEFGGTVPA